MAKQSSVKAQYPSDLFTNSGNRWMILSIKEFNTLSGSAAALKDAVLNTASDVGKIFSGGAGCGGGAPAAKKANKEAKIAKTKTCFAIGLPLPNDINESQSHDWSAVTGAVSDAITKGVNKIAAGMTGDNEDIAMKAIGEGASKLGFRKPLVDPGYFQDYTGSQPREFTFAWDLIPNNADEAAQINKILWNMKKYTLPKSTINGLSLAAPYTFEITIGNDEISKLMGLNQVVCKNLSIQYSADGSLQMVGDGQPKWIKLSATFAERISQTSNLYES